MSGHTLRVQALKPLAGAGQAVSFTGTAAASTAVGDQTKWIKLAATQDCYVEFGLSPTATTSSMFMGGDKADKYFLISPGHKVSAIQVTTAGTLYLHEMVT